MLSLTIPLVAQSDPARTAFSMALSKTVTIAQNPDRLLLSDATAGDTQVMELPESPELLALSGDGRYAAVSFASRVAYINLSTWTMEKTFDLPGPITELAIAGDAIRVNLGDGLVRSLRVDTGEWSEPTISISGLHKDVISSDSAYVLNPDAKGAIRAAAKSNRAAGAPTVVSGNPSNAFGSPQRLTFVGSDPDGAENIFRVYFLVNNSTGIPVNTCHGFYDRPTNSMYLYNDSLTGLLGPLPVGTPGSIQNSQCRVDGATSFVSTAGNSMTVTFGMSLQGTYAATAKNVYIWFKDLQNNDTGWVQTGVWNPSSVTPSIVSATPTAAVGSLADFTVTIRDPQGASNLYRIYFQIGPTPSVDQRTCHGFFDVPTQSFYVYSDTLSVAFGPAVIGGSNVIGNSQCLVRPDSSRVISNTGNELVLRVSMVLLTPFASTQQNVYWWAKDFQNNDSGWSFGGTWVFTRPAALPSIVSGGPALSFGSPQTLRVVASDPNGGATIYRMYFLVNPNASIPVNSCHGFFDLIERNFYLYNDDYSVLQGPAPVGSNTILQNSQCRLNPAVSSFNVDNLELELNANLSLLGTYGQTAKNVYWWAKDLTNNDTGWVATGTWNPNAGNMPSVVGATPVNALASPTLFTLMARDANGFADIFRFYFQIGHDSMVTVNGCHGFYDRPTNSVYLYSDNLGTLLGPLPIGSAGTLQNSQCRIDGTGSTVTGIGTDLTLRWNMSLQGSYAGTTKKVYLWVKDASNNDTGWIQTGTWTQPQ